MGAGFDRRGAASMNVGNDHSLGFHHVFARLVAHISAHEVCRDQSETLSNEQYQYFGLQDFTDMVHALDLASFDKDGSSPG
jgi:hypothetical protein